MPPPVKRPTTQRGIRRTTGRGTRNTRSTRRSSGDGDGGGTKWIIFFLVFVVGNVVLFATTGFVLIPK